MLLSEHSYRRCALAIAVADADNCVANAIARSLSRSHFSFCLSLLSLYPRRVMRAITGIITNMWITRAYERARVSRNRANGLVRCRAAILFSARITRTRTYVRTSYP